MPVLVGPSKLVKFQVIGIRDDANLTMLFSLTYKGPLALR